MEWSTLSLEQYVGARAGIPKEERPALDRERVRRGIERGDLLQAADLAETALRDFPGDADLSYLKALALVQMGHPPEAEDALRESLEKSKEPSVDTVSLMGRIFKDRWARETEPEAADRWMEQALDYYTRASAIDAEDAFPLINRAFCAAMLGRSADVEEVASEVLRLLQGKEQDYYGLASMAEAHALRGDPETAEYFYRKAFKAGRNRTRDLARTRRQARWIGSKLYQDAHHFDACFPIPDILVFAGHIVDAPDRPSPRFPPQVVPSAGLLLRKQLARLRTQVVCASIAAGADILVAEAALERGCALHLFLPWNAEDFEKTSVAPEWRSRYLRLIDAATSVRLLSKDKMPASAIGFDYLNRVMIGTARKLASDLDVGLSALVYWDGNPGGLGGTGSLVRHCLAAGLRVERCFVPPGRPNQPIEERIELAPELPPHTPDPDNPEPVQAVRAMLFADIVGYSRLSDAAIPNFVETFLGLVASELEQAPHPPEIRNTWGDALYLVFERSLHAADFARRLRRAMAAVDWAAHGLPAELSIRIGLHAGPVFPIVDPVQEKPSYTGFHVSWAARIEPTARTGSLYASEEFVALLQLEDPDAVDAVYVGKIPLDKAFWERRIYEILA